MSRLSLSRIGDALATAIIYLAAVAMCCPLLALDGARRLLQRLGVKP